MLCLGFHLRRRTDKLSLDSVLLLCLLINASSAQMPGFVSLDCGGTQSFTDSIGLNWNPDNHIHGQTAIISVPNETRKQYQTLTHFPADSRKYCYTLNAVPRSRYILRASFLYGNFDNAHVYPKFNIALGPTHWSTIVISGSDLIEVRELIFLATSSSVSVCLSNATTGKPFISTLELRQLNGSIYYTDYENQFYLSVSARINFGSVSDHPIRYPDDPFDRLWESDTVKKENYLVDVASGTQKVSTTLPIHVSWREMPPQQVMQTAVVGTGGSLTYRLNLEGFPGFGWACVYFSEIEDLDPDEVRKFSLVLPGQPDISKYIVNIQENALGSYRLYEPGFKNISLPFVLPFRFAKTSDSSRGPLLNAMEINKYLAKKDGSLDGEVIASIISLYASADWAQEAGDPCLPVPWSWVQCSSDAQPRIVKISLSNKNLTGSIPSQLSKLTGLVELWLDGNSLTGSIPDFSPCTYLKIIHLESNRLRGELPSSLSELPNLRELYLQNNMLSGTVASGLLNRKMILNFSGNNNLHIRAGRRKHSNIIVGAIVGAAVILIALITCCMFFCKWKKSHSDREQLTDSFQVASPLRDVPADATHRFTLSEIDEATRTFENNIGSGGFGVVYYGKLKDGKEIAVKVLTNNSYQAKREFENEVILLSRIHHRNLLQFLGYCQELGRSILVYEFMHNGTLKEHLHGPLAHRQQFTWIKRLLIAEDAAKGIEYLHTGSIPAIIHRDLKSSNILLDKHMRAKVSDFGLSKLAVDGAPHISTAVRGTLGYLDPEYYNSQQLTDKSDVYSFGVILLELISGKEVLSNESFGPNCRNIVQWAKLQIESGNLQGIIDQSLGDEFEIQSMWKIAEKALMCVEPDGRNRPSISEVVKDIQDAISIEREGIEIRKGLTPRPSVHSSLNIYYDDLVMRESILTLDDSIVQPVAR